MRTAKNPQKRINEILDSAEYLFHTKGYEQTKIQDIAERMDVAQGTMYYYFKSKSKVLEGVLERKSKNVLYAVRCVEKQHLHGYEKLSAIISAILKEMAMQEGIFLELMYNEQIASFTNKILEYMAIALKQEMETFIGDNDSDKDIKVEQVDTVIFFILELTNDLIDIFCDKLSPQEINARLRMSEKLLAALLDCDEKLIRINIA